MDPIFQEAADKLRADARNSHGDFIPEWFGARELDPGDFHDTSMRVVATVLSKSPSDIVLRPQLLVKMGMQIGFEAAVLRYGSVVPQSNRE